MDNTEEHITTSNTDVQNISKKSLSYKVSTLMYNSLFLGVFCLVSGVLIFLYTIVQPPKNFPVGTFVEFQKDQYVGQLAENLKEKKYIRSVFLFKVFLHLYGADTKILSGNYYFDERLTVNRMAHQFAKADFNQKITKITIPEGSTIPQIALLIHNKIPQISRTDFENTAKGKEGFLFPETYFFYQDATAESVLAKMQDTYKEKVTPLIESLGLNEKEEKRIIILASILEEEGKTAEDKKLIAGILLNRIEKGMPLQVDASINYIKGAASDVSFSDLEIDSPYNTYKNKGLPPGPISNPGLDSIVAALTPTKSKYLYYLTGSDGTFHYAKTFEEHVRNKEKYLR